MKSITVYSGDSKKVLVSVKKVARMKKLKGKWYGGYDGRVALSYAQLPIKILIIESSGARQWLYPIGEQQKGEES